MAVPSRPGRLDFVLVVVTFVVDVEQEINEYVRIVHPAQAEDDDSVKAGQAARNGLDDGRDEDGEGGDEDGGGLCFDGVELDVVDVTIPKCPGGGDEAEDVLCVDGDANADARDVWIGGYAASECVEG